MGMLDIMSRIVSILIGLATLAEKSKPYIKRHKGQTEKDPSACILQYSSAESFFSAHAFASLSDRTWKSSPPLVYCLNYF